MEYPKINSLWKREGTYFDQQLNKWVLSKGKQRFIIGDYSRPEFESVCKWRVSEKIDGTNIRLLFKQIDGKRLIPTIMGRTDAAQIPCHLLTYLQQLATWENFDKAFYEMQSKDYEVYLFGEGYGPKIQAGGGNYRKDAAFILFDVYVGGWWLERDSVKDIAEKLGIPMAPDLGIMGSGQIRDLVKSQPLSLCSETPQVMEGVIARAEPLMLFRDGTPIMWKLKCKEFTEMYGIPERKV